MAAARSDYERLLSNLGSACKLLGSTRTLTNKAHAQVVRGEDGSLLFGLESDAASLNRCVLAPVLSCHSVLTQRMKGRGGRCLAPQRCSVAQRCSRRARGVFGPAGELLFVGKRAGADGGRG